jgi:hypothetical protein
MVWGWVVVGRGSLLSSPNQLFNLMLNSFLHDVGWLGYGRYVLSARPERDCLVTCSSRDMQRTSDQWRSIFLGSHDFQASRCSLRILGNWVVQSIGAGCSDYGNQARYCITGHMTLELICVSSPSFACANFISTAATIGTNYKPNSHKTIGIYAAVLIAQGTMQSPTI